MEVSLILNFEAPSQVMKASVQYTSSCVALHVPKRPNSAKAKYRNSVKSSSLELAASYDEVGLEVSVRPYGRWFGESQHQRSPVYG